MSEDSFLREVEDELRSERLKAFWRRFAPFIVGAVVLVVLLVAGNEIWRWWTTSQANSASERFYAANELVIAGDTDGALDAFRDLAANGPQGYATLARFREAGLLANAGDTAGAVAIYDTLASSAPESALRELALVLAAYMLVDTGDAQGVQTRVASLIDGNSTFALPAREALGLAQYRAGDLDAARDTFELMIASAGANQDVQSRALVYLDVIAADSGEAMSSQFLDDALGDLGIEGLGVEGLGLDLLGTAPGDGIDALQQDLSGTPALPEAVDAPVDAPVEAPAVDTPMDAAAPQPAAQ